MSETQQSTVLEGTAVLSSLTAVPPARRKHRQREDAEPKDGTVGSGARLKKYQFPKGVSGNPGGRPRKLPITDSLKIVIEEFLVPDKLRKVLEKGMGVELPKKLTFEMAIAIGRVVKLFGTLPAKAFDAAEIREMVLELEGRPVVRQLIAGTDEQPAEGNEPINIRERMLVALARMALERMEIYDIHDEKFEGMLEDARKSAMAETQERKGG